MPMKATVHAGERYGRLVVLSEADRTPQQRKHKMRYWLCACGCGKETVVQSAALRSGATRSCGCLAREVAAKKVSAVRTGQRFGRLIVLSEEPERRHRGRVFLCLCDCGKKTVVTGNMLRVGRTRSCGCLEHDVIAAMVAARNTSHGLSRHPLYRTWAAMIARCSNPNTTGYKYYGGRGIEVCSRWLGPNGFPNFLADMGEKPGPEYTLDRINVNGHYEPANCRWATWKEQRANQRRVDNDTRIPPLRILPV